MDRPTNAQIAHAQDREANLRRQLAGRHFYKLGKRVHFAGASLAILLALVSPVVLLFVPEQGPLLGAVSGLWIFLARLVFKPIEKRQQLNGARAQELFDCSVLGLPWNDALVRRTSEEEIRRSSGELQDIEGARGWYPTETAAEWPTSVLVCQRANVVWARRQHSAYQWVLVVVAAAWFVIGVVVAVADAASLASYLTTILLPSLPALLDAAEVSGQHRSAAKTRHDLEDRIDALLRTGAASEHNLRELQDQLFTLRRDGPMIPEWFYRIVRPRYESDMQYAASQVAHESSDTRQAGGSDGT